MERIKYLIKNIGLLAISNFASKILIFFLVPVYTNVLTTTEYGIYDLSVSTISFLYPILTLCIDGATTRFLMDKNYDKKEVTNVGIKYVSISCVIVGIILFILVKLDILTVIKDLAIYIFLYYFAYVFNQLFISLAKGFECVADMSISGVIGTIITITSNLLFLLVFNFGLKGFFIANIISLLGQALYLFIRMRIWTYFSFQSYNIKSDMLSYSIPLIATNIGWLINSTADRYIVTLMCGVNANGMFSISYKIPQIINAIQTIFIQAWQITAIKEYLNDDYKNFYGITFFYVNLFMCITCSFLIILTRQISFLIFAKEFYQAWVYVPFLLISSVLNSASGLLGPILSAKKDTKSMMFAALIGSITNILLNVFLIKHIGVQGATIATLISSYIIYLMRKIKCSDDIKIKNYSKIYIVWCLLIVQSYFEILSISYIFEIIIMLLLLLINYKEIIWLINKAIKNIKKSRNNNYVI